MYHRIKIILAGFLFLLVASGAMADPFLISDPYGPCGESGQTMCPVAATIYADGVIIADDVPLTPELAVSYDLLSRPVGEVVYTAKFKDELGGESDPSNPCLLLPKPSAPLNTRVALSK